MTERHGMLRRAWREEKPGVLAVLALLILAVLAVAAPLYAQPPDIIHPLRQLQPPSLDHLFGTDNYGRDILSRTLYAGRVSLGLGLLITVFTSALGALIGLLAGFVGWLDGPLMRIVDGMMAFPPLILAIALVAAMGAGILSEFIALSVVFTPRMARVVRSSALQLKNREFVDAARISGVSDWRIVLTHVLPNGLAPLIVQASFNYAEAILADAALSFLGLGIPPPTPTWGNMIAASRTYLTVDPWFALFPGLAIVAAVMALNIAGDSLRALLGGSRVRGERLQQRKLDKAQATASTGVQAPAAQTLLPGRAGAPLSTGRIRTRLPIRR